MKAKARTGSKKLNYIERVIKETPTRLWINNPTGPELDKAIACGAVSGTTNPAYPYKLLQHEPEYIAPIIKEAVKQIDDDSEAADIIYQRVSTRFMRAFLPLYEQSGGKEGFVTMQDDPVRDESPQLIVESSLRHSKVGRNYMAKIPVVESGIEAMSELLARDIPVCATECFSISQAVAMCEVYENTSHKCGKSPPFFITHITGIFDDDIQAYVKRHNVNIAPQLVKQAGLIVARKEYKLIKERGYHTTMLGGGARGMHHFTELVGGQLHVTLNWSTVKDLIDADTAVTARIDVDTPADIIEELSDKLPDFRKAYEEDGLPVKEFAGFSPLLRFRKNFTDAIDGLKKEIAKSRNA